MTAAPPPTPPDAGPNPDGYGLQSANLTAPQAAPVELPEALEPDHLQDLAMRGWSWVRAELLTPDAALQILLVALAIVASMALSRPLRALIDRLFRPIADRRFTPRVRDV